jgi:hypothetical protein
MLGAYLNWTLPRRRNQCLRYKVYLSESNAAVLLSTVLSIVTLGTAIAITE